MAKCAQNQKQSISVEANELDSEIRTKVILNGSLYFQDYIFIRGRMGCFLRNYSLPKNGREKAVKMNTVDADGYIGGIW